jgi:hypothetical protein
MAKRVTTDLAPTAQSALLEVPSIDALASGGFTEEVVIKVGDPTSKEGVIPMHVGQLIGPGADIELADEAGHMPTWQLHPIVTVDGKLAPQANVIHTVIASSQLDAAYKRAQATMQSTGKKVWVGAEFISQGKNAKGQPLNKFRVCYKLVD